MPKKCEFTIDWKAEAEAYRDEMYASIDRERNLNERLTKEIDRANNLQETLFLLTNIIKELKEST